MIVQVKWEYEKLAFFGQYLALFRKRHKTLPYTMEDEYSYEIGERYGEIQYRGGEVLQR